MTNGTLNFFNSTKGFGFIQPDDGSKDTFVHISAVERAGLPSLYEGQKLSYELETGRDGRASPSNLRAKLHSQRARMLGPPGTSPPGAASKSRPGRGTPQEYQ
jgi:CspA family cold shock protein